MGSMTNVSKIQITHFNYWLITYTLGVNATVSWISTAHLVASGHDRSMGCRHTPDRCYCYDKIIFLPNMRIKVVCRLIMYRSLVLSPICIDKHVILLTRDIVCPKLFMKIIYQML
ncbi:hypothetical protein HanIR_Chr09g0414551 [Helianthus annuus]|nr:hypothetical protein HanIR_Chr09g0414551 [Helianthus annuus]